MSDVCGSCLLWWFRRDWLRQAERLCWVSRFQLDKSWLIYQGRWTHGDSAGTSNLLRWGTSGYGGCCSLGARTWSGHRVLSLGMCDSLILLGSGTSDWSGHRALSLGMCDSLTLLGGCTLYCRGCWSWVIWDWFGCRTFSLRWCDSLLLLCKGHLLLAVFT